MLGRACGLEPEELEPRRMRRAWLRDVQGRRVDQVLVCAFTAPRTYTGEDVVEVHGHGGELNMDRVLACVLELGARLADPGEFTRRAFLNGRLDLAQAEAVGQLIAARSDQAARNATAILAGALGQRVGRLRQALLRMAADLEAGIDFADDVDEPDLVPRLRSRHREVARQVDALARSYRVGRRLDGAVVALVGPVNAGKSSLFNALLESRRALVSEEPGTTRDYLEAEVHWDGRRIVLVDTAGASEAEASGLEREGQALAREVVARADLLIHVVDLPGGHMPAPPAGPRPVVVAANKLDLCAVDETLDPGEPGDNVVAVVSTSATTGHGLDALRDAVLRGLGVHEPEEGAAVDQAETVVITRARQHDALGAAQRALAEGEEALSKGLPPELTVEHYRAALEALGQITGEAYTEAVLDAVFDTFCVGK